MVYLSEKNYVHLDLAARNCLLGPNNHIKLCDFGLTRKLPKGQRYMKVCVWPLYAKNGVTVGCLIDFCSLQIVEKGGKMPLKWLPVESLFKGIFGQASDIWAFGVTVRRVFLSLLLICKTHIFLLFFNLLGVGAVQLW